VSMLSPHFTRAHRPEVNEALERTRPGQAAFAVPSSPHTCGACRHWQKVGKSKGRRCLEFVRLMRGKRGAELPADTKACSVFEAGEP
jgi:hypothetical protein